MAPWPLTVRRRVRRLLQEVSELELDGRDLGLARKAAELLPELRERHPPPRLVLPAKVASVDKTPGAAEERRRIRTAVMLRDGTCCAPRFAGITCSGGPEFDHFFGRGRVPESVATIWVLCMRHHRMKTDGEPSRRAWLARFREHAEVHEYLAEVARVLRLIAMEEGQHPTVIRGGNPS